MLVLQRKTGAGELDRHTSLTAEIKTPPAASLLIFAHFSSIDAWTYRSSVIVVFACPRISDRDLISNPTSTALVAKVWRNV